MTHFLTAPGRVSARRKASRSDHAAVLACLLMALAAGGKALAQTGPVVDSQAPATLAAPDAGQMDPGQMDAAPVAGTGAGQDAAPLATAPAPTETATTTPSVAPAVAPAAAPARTGDLHGADLSPMGMYRAAHWVVKGVMLSLCFAAFLTWTVLVFKMIEMLVARARARRAARTIHDADTLAQAAGRLAGRSDPAAFMASAALTEVDRSGPALDLAGPDGVKERVRSLLDRVDAQASARMRRGIGLLATIGSTAPFVGLFGTVWGIMNAFIGIAESQTTNLAVVAPGIAEALLATAVGLIAAIPAVVFYNHFAREIAGFRLVLADAAAGVERLVSRDLDFRHLALPGAAGVSASPGKGRG